MSSGVSLFLAGMHAGYSLTVEMERKQWNKGWLDPSNEYKVLAISVNHLPKCWGTCTSLSSALIILLIHWFSGAKWDTLYSLSMTSSQHAALKCLRNLRLTPNVKKFPVIVLIQCCYLRNNTCYYSAGKAQTPAPLNSLPFHPFGVPVATHPHPGGSGAWTVRQSTQRQGSLKSNFMSVCSVTLWKDKLPQRNTVVMARRESTNDARYYFSLFFVLLAVTWTGRSS